MKNVQIQSFSGQYFPVFQLDTEIYSVISVFSPNNGKYGTEKTPYLDILTWNGITWNVLT